MSDIDRLGPYILGPSGPNVGIYQGNACKLSKAIPDESCNIAVFDPPYGIKWQCAWRIASEQFDPIVGDSEIDVRWMPELHRVIAKTGAAIIFTRWDIMEPWKNAMVESGFTVKNCLVWDKGFHGCGDLFGAFAPQHEFALFGTKGRFQLAKRKPDVIRVNRVNPSDLIHPAQKPVELMLHILEAVVNPGGIVIDWFTGSGTLPVACKILGHRYLAFEIDEQTCELARERVRQTQPPLFTLPPQQLTMSLDPDDNG